MFYTNSYFEIEMLENLTREEYLKMKQKTRSGIRLALSQSIPYCNGPEKIRLMNIRSKLISFTMGVKS
jgi:hypothetical protein